MATAVTAPAPAGLVYHSFPIEKFDEDPETGTLYVYGKATTPEVDSDEQVVDPDWSAKAMETWFATGPNVRVMHNPSAMPAGSGVKVEINRDGDGAHWVKAAVDEPTAKLMVKRRHLRAFSVGIAKPLIVRDVTGKARGGIIKGGELAEISLVDRPANRSCYVEIAKSAADGSCEFTGKVVGGDFLAKSVPVDLPPDVSVSFSPSDLAKLLEHRRVAEERTAAKRDMDPDVGGGVDRDKIPAEDFAGRNRSFPIVKPGDVSDAASSIGRAGEGNYSAGKLKENIIAIARRKGPQFEAELPDAWKDGGSAGKGAAPAKPARAGKKCKLCKGSGKIRGGNLTCPRCHGDGLRSPGEPGEHGDTAKGAAPDVAKAGAKECPGCGKSHHADSPAKFCDDCGAKLPGAAKAGEPDAAKGGAATRDKPGGAGGEGDAGDGDAGGDGDGDGDGDGAGEDEDDGGDDDGMSKAAAKAAAKADKRRRKAEKRAARLEAELAALKAGKPSPGDGVTGEHTRPVPAHREPDGPDVEALEHDAGLPTDPDAPRERDAEKAAALRFKALGVPHGLGVLHDLTCAAYHPSAVAKAHPGATLASVIDPGEWQAKALDAAASAPLDAAGRAQLLWQHALTLKGADPEDVADVAEAVHKAFADANPGPGTFPAPGELSARRFNRPYITAGHAAPSPGHDAPSAAKVPPSGGITAGQFSRGYLDAGHAADSPSNKGDGGRPKPGRLFYRNTARDNAREAMRAMHDHIAQTFPDLCPMASDPGAPPAPEPNAVPHPAGAPKARKAAKKGRKAAKKGRKAQGRKAAAAGAREFLAKAASPDLVKAAVAEAVTAAVAERDAAHGEELRKLRKLLKSQAAAIDAIAAQPDAAGAPWRGAPLQPPQPPEGTAATVTKSAERAQVTQLRSLAEEWRTSPDPVVRERAWQALTGKLGISASPGSPMT